MLWMWMSNYFVMSVGKCDLLKRKLCLMSAQFFNLSNFRFGKIYSFEMGLDNTMSNLFVKNHRVKDEFIYFMIHSTYQMHHLLALIAQGVMLAFWPFVVQKEKRLIRISTKSSNTSNNMDTEIPRYNDREPPIADTMVPVICKMRLYPIGYLLSFMPLK